MGRKDGVAKKSHRYHPYERKERSPRSSDKENSNLSPLKIVLAASGKKEKIKKKKNNMKERDDDLDLEREGLGGAAKLEELRKQLCPKNVKITLERLHCKEIMVTTPSKGKREIFYWSYASDDEDSEEDDDNKPLDSDGNPLPCGRRVPESSHLKYDDWRVQTIKAYPSSALTTITSAVPTTATAAVLKENEKEDSPSIFIQVPFYYDYVFKVGHAQDDLHTILDLLTGGSSSTMMIDAYLLLRLEKYYKDMSEQVVRYKLKMISNRDNVNPYEFRGASKKNGENSLQKKLPPPPKVINYHYLSINFLPVQDRDQPVSTFKPNLKFLPDLTQLTPDVQLIAPLYASKHLYLAVFNFRSKVVTVYDSSWHYLPKELREGQVTTILRYLLNNQQDLDTSLSEPYSKSLFSQWNIDWQNRSCPQYDEYSCGIYTIHYADNVLRGIADEKHYWKLSDKRVMQIRRHIAKELLSTTQVGRQLLQAISS